MTTSNDRTRALSELGSLATAINGPRTHVLTFTSPSLTPEPTLPRSLAAQQTLSFDLPIGPRPANGHCTLHVALDACPTVAAAELAVSVNAQPCRWSRDLPRDRNYTYNNTRVWHVVKNVAETGARVLAFDVPLAALQSGSNRITIMNPTANPLAITWLELALTD
ncbi:MAG: hypothetical protein EOM63_08085 [Clostridia bacterium]|nr:hypothetical protein [Clostridia bacterium]